MKEKSYTKFNKIPRLRVFDFLSMNSEGNDKESLQK